MGAKKIHSIFSFELSPKKYKQGNLTTDMLVINHRPLNSLICKLHVKECIDRNSEACELTEKYQIGNTGERSTSL